MCRIIAIANQKGGVGKSTSTGSLGAGLAKRGKRVLVIDADSQGSLTESMGYRNPDEMTVSLATLLTKVINDEDPEPTEGILHHAEGFDLLPCNIDLASLEVAMVNVMSRETVLKRYLKPVQEQYDYILIDCMPSLGVMTINALAAADSVLIPVQAAYLPVKGLQQLLKTISRVKRQMNPRLRIEGILVTMADYRTNYAKDVTRLMMENYGQSIRIFSHAIPLSVRAAETSAEGVSIYRYDPNGKVAAAYDALTEEVMAG
ncbi:MAG: ParA family protein [Lachnospiraceae bacterium]|nr:ParA family protein [Lachnospiraceae bacterium]